jgi:hypothetical protein
VKRLIALAVAAVALGAAATALVMAVPAGAAKKPTLLQRVTKLEKQVTVLNQTVKTLQSRERFDRSEISANYTGDSCLAATMADLFQSTWATIDQGATKPKFTTEPQIDDKGACQTIGVTRLGITTPPTITTVLNALITWITG